MKDLMIDDLLRDSTLEPCAFEAESKLSARQIIIRMSASQVDSC